MAKLNEVLASRKGQIPLENENLRKKINCSDPELEILADKLVKVD
jgi:hypothetical protein